jgi:SAM-dependent methyltransferase
MTAPSWTELLACPACHDVLDPSDRCVGCGHGWARAGGLLDLVPPGFHAAHGGPDGRWREALAGLAAWRARQPPRVGARVGDVDPRITRLLADAGLAGAVIDVGGKDGAKRHAMPSAVRRYLCVDPCAEATPDAAGEPERSWGAVRGVAEALPVRSGAADGVFSTAAMDYFVDTARGVAEFARVLRAGGTLALLVTVHPPAVARAREGHSRGRRALGALRRAVVREVGWRGALSLLADGARAGAREHTRYLTEPEVTAALDAHFDLRSLARDVGRYSTTLRVVATRRA